MFRGNICSHRPLKSPVVAVKGAREGLTSPSSHFASRLQEQKLQSAEKYSMEKDKIYVIYEPHVR